ncbi:MAG: ABC transporter permease [Saprospiraceae bacterium]|nr:ABC transporter permease [Saprospiraceae bacterium]
MFSNYYKIALRSLRRQPFFSGINITGLGVGLAACWLIGLYVQHERSYDQFLPNAPRICAVSLDLKMGQEEGQTTNTPPPLGPRLAADFPEIELAARTFYLQESVVRRDKPGQAPLTFNESRAYAADSAFLELFGFPMLEGDAATALDRPGSLVLSEAAARRYFGDQSPMGQALSINDRLFTVTGVARELPSHSTVQFDFLLPTADFKVVDRFSWSWIWLQMDTWVRLRETPTAESLAALEAKFPAMVLRHAPAAYERVGQNFEEQLRRGDRYDVRLLPLLQLHLGYPELSSRLTTLGDGGRVQTFALIGVLILLLACVNFMNLSTARSAMRAREVGVRKSLGSQRGALVAQFMSESLLFSMAALVLAGVLSVLCLPLFNRLTGLEMEIPALFSGTAVPMALSLMLLAALLGGIYPALFLSRFKPMETLKTAAGSTKGGHASVRSSLVVFQFAVSIVLMIGSWGVYRQLEFAQTNSPGLQRENVLVIPTLRNFENQTALESFRQQVAQLPEVKEVTHSIFLPSIGSFGDFYEPEQGEQESQVVQNLPLSSFLTDKQFVPALGMEIIAGRNFEDDHSLADSTSVILNEAAVKAIGWEQPLGKWLRYPGNANQRFQVVGIVRDFHLGSIKAPIEPAAIFHASSKTYRTWASYVSARLHPGAEKAAVEKVAALWAAAVPKAPFDYDYLDASFARLYRTEAQTGGVLGALTGLALFIGCLGLFALAAFTAEQRTKEIGIRKVLGASVTSVTALLSRDFLKLVLISFLLAAPIAYYLMDKWLSDYAYRIHMEWWMFAATGLGGVVIAFLTVSFQSIRAALTNPVKSLRSE